MIPIRDRLKTQRTPYFTWAIIAFNVVAFLYERAMLEGGYVHFVEDWGFVPARFLADPPSEAVTIATAMFLHGGWLHLGGNMLFLWIFGDNIEDRLGHGRFVGFYLASGVAAALAQLFIDPSSTVPMVGASGAIAGVLGAYFYLYPRSPIVVAVPIFIFIQFFELPAWLVILYWFGLQVLEGVVSLASPVSAGVAFFAHIGGFLFGLVMAALLVRRAQPPLDEWRPPGAMRPRRSPYDGWD